MKKRVLAMLLATILTLGAAIPALAYEAPDFSDVPANHWAYAPIMEMAEQGVIKGVGGDRFDPNGKLTAEMFLTLIGRVIFPDVEADGADWSGPYVEKAKAEGLLEKTSVTDETLKHEITRYDVAAIFRNMKRKGYIPASLYTDKSDGEKAGVNPQELGDMIFDDGISMESVLSDWSSIPKDRADSVEYVYKLGLMTGDQNRSFCGEETLTRMEAATVLQRFLTLREKAVTARKLRKERIQKELEELTQGKGSALSQEELTDLLVMMDHDSFWWMQDFHFANYYSNSSEEEWKEVLANLGLSEEGFKAAWEGAQDRQVALHQARISMEGLTGETISTFSSAELGEMLCENLSWYHLINEFDNLNTKSGLGDLEDQDLAQLMGERGITAKMLEDAYWAAEEKEVKPAVDARIRDENFEEATKSAAVIAIIAARMAKIEGKESFTFRARAHIMLNELVGLRNYDKEAVWLGLYGEDGQLLGKAKLFDRGAWELDVTIDPKNFEDKFTLKLMGPYTIYMGDDHYSYCFLPEKTGEFTGTMGDFIEQKLITLRGEIR